MQLIYTRKELEVKSRQELWAICDKRGITRHRTKQECIFMILAVQPQPAEDISADLNSIIKEQAKAARAYFKAQQKAGVKI